MPIDTSHFIVGENKFEGLPEAAEAISRERYRNQQLDQQKYERQQAQDAKKVATAKFLEGYYDPKDHLTGTIYDPEVTKSILDLRNEAQQMVNNGVSDPNMITAALAPKANRLFQYSQAAKSINENVKAQLQQIPANSGYRKDALLKKSLEAAFLDLNGKMKDITTLDPNTDWIGEAVKRYPGDVTDNTGLVEYIQKVPKGTQLLDAKTYNSKGGFTRKKLKVTAPEFMQLDKDERGNDTRELVPKFELAADDETPIIHPFKDKDGKIVNAAVRLVDENVFKQILASNPSYADNLRGQVMQAIEQYKNPDGSTIDINSPQATNVARALLYDDLKNLKPGSVEDVVETKPTQIKVYSGGGSGGSSKPAKQWDLTEYDIVPDATNGEGRDITQPFSGYKVTAIGGETLLAKKVIFHPSTKKFTVTEYVSRDKDGNPSGEKTKTYSATTFRQNLENMNPGTDMKNFDALVNQNVGANNQPPKQATSNSTYTIKGKKYSLSELEKMGYTAEQVSTYKDK